MHPRVAARIGLKLLGFFLFASAVPTIFQLSVQLANMWVYSRNAGGVGAGFGGPTYPWWQQWLPMVGGPMIQLCLAAVIYFRADAIAKRIAPPVGRLCPDCGYDLKGIKDGACPECGTLAPSKVRKAARESSAGGTNH